MPRISLPAGLALLAGAAALAPSQSEAEPPTPVGWWKGNTHTHTLWSDGNGAPERVAAWYRDRGYDFLVLSDHNVLSSGERWVPIAEDRSPSPAAVDELSEQFGAGWVAVRAGEQGPELRLKTLAELRARLEVSGEFLLVQGEEVTDDYAGYPVHVNALNIEAAIAPQKGASVRETLQRNIDAIAAHGERSGRPVLAHVNHPNFGWALAPEDIASIRGERFFEVYNGHSAVRNYGDEAHPGLEELWDIALTLRLTELDLGLLYGLASDDAHDYQRWGPGRDNPGRGWVMVRADELEADALIEALQAGEFYASSGVVLEDVQTGDGSYSLKIAAEPGLVYTTRFVGTRLVDGEPGPVGELLLQTEANPAVYRFGGDELYVRAAVSSSREHPNPYAVGDREMAWAQPVRPSAGR